MNQLTETNISCPYCGESIAILVDSSDFDQQYIEDCQVCCKPITFLATEDFEGEITVNAFSEDDVF